MRYLKIPQNRIGVLIGPHGATKQDIEDKSGIKIDIDSKSGEIALNEHDIDDPLQILKTESIIRAIGRGFSPERAMRLLNDDVELHIFDIHDYVGKKDSHVKRIKGRIIGKKGKAKQVLEELTETHISVYGHTVSVIADVICMDIVKKAIDMLLTGSRHPTVYRYIESNLRKLKFESMF
jgi:ribosomal RNA assembly protein